MDSETSVTRRVPLTVDLDCKRCGGTGRIKWRELAPGAEIRYGGPRAPQVERERLCPCVEVDRDE